MLTPYFEKDHATLYQCDNLELMKQLPPESIDLIYCDILYNTGKKFKHYDDKLGTPKEAMEWYIPRVIEMKRLLKETGSIYLQCDYRLVHYLKVEMDGIFGIENFINEIIWYYTLGGKSNKYFAKKHDAILWYSKSSKYTFNDQEIRIPLSPNKHDKKGVDYGGRNGVDENGRMYVEKWGTGRKKLYRYYIDEGKIPEDVWIDINTLHYRVNEYVDYSTQKPKALLERIIKASSNSNDTIADFFMGSGTTGEVALELGRKFIGCDVGDKACEISKKRIENIKSQ